MTKIFIIDGHKLLRDGLRSLIDRQPDMKVVGESKDGKNMDQLTNEIAPDIVIMETETNDSEGVKAVKRITADFRDAKVIILSMYADKNSITKLLGAGVAGFLPKHASFRELRKAIRIVAGNQNYLSPRIAGSVIGDYVNREKTKNGGLGENLSPREREVLQLIAEGWKMKKIASKLNMSVKTVETHRRNVMEKSNAHSVAELTKFAIQEGITYL